MPGMSDRVHPVYDNKGSIRRTVTALDGSLPPNPEASVWPVNAHGYGTARLKLNLDLAGTKTLANDPILTCQWYTRTPRDSSAGTHESGRTGTAFTITRPRVTGLTQGIYCFKTTDAGATYTDYSATLAPDLSSLDTIANGDYMLVGVPYTKDTFMGLDITMNAVNGNAATLQVKYWNGSAFAAVTAMVDGTVASATKTLSGSGQVTWQRASDWAASTINSANAFWIQVGVSAALDASTTLTGFDLLLPITDSLLTSKVYGADVYLGLVSIANGAGITDAAAKTLTGSIDTFYS